jgi:ABC-type lipoprotein release transport system permease subunit
MDKNRQILILFVAIVILSLVAVLFLFSGGKKEDGKKMISVSPTKIIYPTSWQTPKEDKTPTPTLYIPKGRIKIDSVLVNDIYEKPILINDEKDVKFAANENYEFVYQPKYHKFIITILGKPFLSLINQASEDFVKVLGVEKAEACKFNVDIGTVAFANPEYAGRRYTLSFCKK